jgi:hypothetical protein
MASSAAGERGTFQPVEKAQSQDRPGLEKHLEPPSESTKLESGEGFVEYVGAGKLRNKKVLITGGEYVASCLEFQDVQGRESVYHSAWCFRN